MGISVRSAMRTAFVALVFTAGYVVGTLGSQPAEAQIGEMAKELEKDVLEKAAGSEGILGEAARLGTSITEMEQNVSALQKNLDVLKEIKAALGG